MFDDHMLDYDNRQRVEGKIVSTCACSLALCSSDATNFYEYCLVQHRSFTAHIHSVSSNPRCDSSFLPEGIAGRVFGTVVVVATLSLLFEERFGQHCHGSSN